MRNIKIVSDSSSDILELSEVSFASAPLKIITSEREFVDNSSLDIKEMVDFLDKYKGRSSSSCPNAEDWLTAFGDADEIFCVAITSGLSGSYNSACVAKNMYEEMYPSKRVCVIDSLSAGPEISLIIEKLEKYIVSDLSYEEICEKIKGYLNNTGLLFMLKSLKNFANNGRVSTTVAKITGLIGICIVGKASNEGTLEPMHKCRGESRSLEAIIKELEMHGFSSGRVSIAHCFNESGALRLKEMIQTKFDKAEITIHPVRGLCSFYAEKGGLLVGFEKNQM